MLTCRRCGQNNPDGFQFCGACGAPFADDGPATREERKVVTVLFCDLVGSTARAESMDPEDVRAVLRAYHERARRELEYFGGTVEKFIGDAVMALFGAPVAHENDPERAVRAALAIREWATAASKLQVRIGITTGEALVILDARPEAGEGMAAGDVVNTASRLQSAAPVNGVLVDEMTFRATRRVIEYAETRTLAVSGKAQAIGVWDVVRLRSGADAEPAALTPLVGRQEELSVLIAALRRVRENRETQLVTLVGVPGIGKTRLVRELVERLDGGAGGTRFAQGRAAPYGDEASFRALSEVVGAQVGVVETDTSDLIDAKLRRTVATLLGDATEEPWVEGHLRPLLGLSTDTEFGTDRRGEAFAAWRRFLEAAAEEHPLVLVFEDLHFADEGLLDFVDYLVEWTSDVPLLVLATMRPELLARRPGWGGGKQNATSLTLAPLTDEETARVVESVVDPGGGAQVSWDLLSRAGGNPLYAEEFARLLAEGREPEELPENVQGIIAARLDALPASEKALLQDAAVLGEVFWLGALVSGSNEERSIVEDHLHALERKQFVRRERRPTLAGEVEYGFRHRLVREVAYAQIPRSARGDKHLRAADWLEMRGRNDERADMLAHHYLSALDLARAAGREVAGLAERAVPVLRQAGDRAVTLNASSAAVRYYRRASELLPLEHPERPLLLFHLGRALWMADASGEEELLAARDGLLEGGNLHAAAEAEAVLADVVRLRGDRDGGARHLEAAAALAHELEPSRSKAYVLSAVAGRLVSTRDMDRAIVIGREALALAETLGMDEVRARALTYIGFARASLGDDAGMTDLEESVKVGLATGSAEVIRGYSNLAHHVRHRGDLTRSAELVEEALRLADRFGNAPFRRFVEGPLPHIRYRQGRWNEALELAERFLDEVQASHISTWHALNTRGHIRLARGDDGGIEDSIASAAAARKSADPDTLTAALESYSWALIVAGRRDEAAPILEEALSLTHSAGVRPGFDLPFLVRVTVELGLGHERVLGVARPSRWADAARRYLATDYGGAADIYRAAGSPTDEAEARQRAARTLIEAGKLAEAMVQLQSALVFYRSVGATRYVRELEVLQSRLPGT